MAKQGSKGNKKRRSDRQKRRYKEYRDANVRVRNKMLKLAREVNRHGNMYLASRLKFLVWDYPMTFQDAIRRATGGTQLVLLDCRAASKARHG